MPIKEIEVGFCDIKEVSKGHNVRIKDSNGDWYSWWTLDRTGAEKFVTDNGIYKGVAGMITYDIKGNFKNMTKFEPSDQPGGTGEEVIHNEGCDCADCINRREAELAKSDMQKHAITESREKDVELMTHCLEDAKASFSAAYPTWMAVDNIVIVYKIAACLWISRDKRRR